MELMKDSPSYQRNKLLRHFGREVTSKPLADKILQVMGTSTEKEAQAELLCDIITSAKTEAEMLEKIEALEELR